MARQTGLRRATYWIEPWQIRAIRALATARGQSPSTVVRALLTVALRQLPGWDGASPPPGLSTPTVGSAGAGSVSKPTGSGPVRR